MSLVDTWIETCWNHLISRRHTSRVPRGHVDWNCKRATYKISRLCRVPRGHVDWNWIMVFYFFDFVCRVPRGHVDWNSAKEKSYQIMPVVSLVDTWIETLRGYGTNLCPTVVSLVDTWIETLKRLTKRLRLTVVSLVDTWIETPSQHGKVYWKKSCPSWTRGLKLRVPQGG